MPAYVAAVTPLLDNEQGEHAAVDGRRALPWWGAPCLLSGRTVTDIRLAFERLQHDHDAKTFGFATEGPSLTWQEFAEECVIVVVMACGRCLRPALYSSLRSSPSHPTGVSALRVTIAIASTRFARKQWGLRPLPSGGGSFAVNRPPADMFGQALLENRPQWAELHVVANRREVPCVSWLGSRALGKQREAGAGEQDKSNGA